MIELLFEGDHVLLNLVEFDFILFAVLVGLSYLRLHLDNCYLFLSQFVAKHIKGAVFNFTLEVGELAVTLVNTGLQVFDGGCLTLVRGLQLGFFLLETLLYVEDLFLFTSELPAHLRDFMLQLFLKLDNSLFTTLEV